MTNCQHDYLLALFFGRKNFDCFGARARGIQQFWPRVSFRNKYWPIPILAETDLFSTLPVHRQRDYFVARTLRWAFELSTNWCFIAAMFSTISITVWLCAVTVYTAIGRNLSHQIMSNDYIKFYFVSQPFAHTNYFFLFNFLQIIGSFGTSVLHRTLRREQQQQLQIK